MPTVPFRVLLCACFCLCAPLVVDGRLAAQVLPVTDDDPRKQARAVRVADGAIRLDGRIDDEAWRTVPSLTGFAQRQPDEGQPPSDAMDVRIAFDGAALYVGARLSSRTPVQAPLGRRDEAELAEHLLVSLDPYLDRRTASTFGITAAGVRIDRYYGSDNRNNADDGFNPVWEGRAAVYDGGWSAELRIPFSQLRFNARDPQVWGLNVQRWVPSRNEDVYWSLLPRTDERWASRFGDLSGLDGIRPGRRLELLPYVSGASRLAGDRDVRDPFTSAADFDGGIGLDAKVGIGSNLTLEATINPDFGQVEADPAEVNLSAFETFFDERRSFFLEGAELLRSSVNNYFYSRRIGAPPAVRADGEFVDAPHTTTILGAAKLTGRLASGTSVGALGAVTGEESARVFNTGIPVSRTRVTPRTVFGVARVQQEFGPAGSTIGLMTTAMHRDLPAGDPLAAVLTRNAFSLSGDSLLRLRDGEYDLRSYLGVSHVDGDAPAIDRVQRGSAHYFQRPDAPYFDYDPLRTSLTGIKTGADIQRRTGRHWLWQANVEYESPGFETNDMGRLTTADGPVVGGEVQYRETVPGGWYRDYSIGVRHERRWNYDGDRREGMASTWGFLRWPNFWETEASFTYRLPALDDRLTRGGPLMQAPGGWVAEVEAENSDSARTRVDFTSRYGRDEDDGLEFVVDTALAIQPGSQWQLSAGPRYERIVETQQFVTALGGGRPETFGGRYVFARLDRSTYATEFRVNYTFQPDLTLDFYAEPFAASGSYTGPGELAAARSRVLRVYGRDGGTTTRPLADGGIEVRDGDATFVIRPRDFNVVSFRSNLVLRWEWRAGSTFYFVWQQNRAAEELAGTRAGIGDMFNSLRASGDNFLAVKASFWIGR